MSAPHFKGRVYSLIEAIIGADPRKDTKKSKPKDERKGYGGKGA